MASPCGDGSHITSGHELWAVGAGLPNSYRVSLLSHSLFLFFSRTIIPMSIGCTRSSAQTTMFVSLHHMLVLVSTRSSTEKAMTLPKEESPQVLLILFFLPTN